MVISKTDRQRVFDMYGGKCAYCGCPLEKGWHVDHVEPIRRDWKYVLDERGLKTRDSKGEYAIVKTEMHPDRNHVNNYMPSCPSCNINKHGDTIEGFRLSIYKYLNSLNERMVQYKMAKKYGLIEETGKPVVFYFEIYNYIPPTNDCCANSCDGFKCESGTVHKITPHGVGEGDGDLHWSKNKKYASNNTN